MWPSISVIRVSRPIGVLFQSSTFGQIWSLCHFLPCISFLMQTIALMQCISEFGQILLNIKMCGLCAHYVTVCLLCWTSQMRQLWRISVLASWRRLCVLEISLYINLRYQNLIVLFTLFSYYKHGKNSTRLSKSVEVSIEICNVHKFIFALLNS